VRQERQNIASISALRVEADDRDVLVDTRGKNILGDHASTSECDAIAGNVKQDVIGLENDATKSVGLFV
jgi:hypothetical protein